MTKLLQYKPEHYGKCYDFEPMHLSEDSESTVSVHKHLLGWGEVPGDQNILAVPITTRAYQLFIRGSVGSDDADKVILIPAGKKVIRSKLLPKYKTTYLKVQATIPYTDKVQQFWVREEWTEPMKKYKSYLEEMKAVALKSLKAKGKL